MRVYIVLFFFFLDVVFNIFFYMNKCWRASSQRVGCFGFRAASSIGLFNKTSRTLYGDDEPIFLGKLSCHPTIKFSYIRRTVVIQIINQLIVYLIFLICFQLWIATESQFFQTNRNNNNKDFSLIFSTSRLKSLPILWWVVYF